MGYQRAIPDQLRAIRDTVSDEFRSIFIETFGMTPVDAESGLQPFTVRGLVMGAPLRGRKPGTERQEVHQEAGVAAYQIKAYGAEFNEHITRLKTAESVNLDVVADAMSDIRQGQMIGLDLDGEDELKDTNKNFELAVTENWSDGGTSSDPIANVREGCDKIGAKRGPGVWLILGKQQTEALTSHEFVLGDAANFSTSAFHQDAQAVVRKITSLTPVTNVVLGGMAYRSDGEPMVDAGISYAHVFDDIAWLGWVDACTVYEQTGTELADGDTDKLGWLTEWADRHMSPNRLIHTSDPTFANRGILDDKGKELGCVLTGTLT